MKFAQKALLLAVLAVVGSAVTPQATLAIDLVVAKEPSGTACPEVVVTGTNVTGGCLMHASSEAPGVTLRKHVMGIETTLTTCNYEFHGRLDLSARGYFTEQVLSGPSCTRQACKDAAGEAEKWRVVGVEGTPQGTVEGTEYLITTLCLEPLGGGTDELCEIDIPINQQVAATHVYEMGHAFELSAHGVSGFRCELVGHWNTEVGGTHDTEMELPVEITHFS